MFEYSAYSKKGILKHPNPKIRRFITDKTPILHGSYKGSGNKKSGFISTYLVKASAKELIETAKANHIEIEIRDLFRVLKQPEQKKLFKSDEQRNIPIKSLDETVDELFSLQMEHRDLGSERLNKRLIMNTRHDVFEFNNKNPPKEILDIQEHFRIVETIKRRSRIVLIKPSAYKLKKEGKGRYDFDCLWDLGDDYSIGCFANTLPDLTSDNGFRCGYCYATFQNGIPFPEEIFLFDKKQYIDNTISLIYGILLNEMAITRTNVYEESHSRIIQKIGRDYTIPRRLNKDLDAIIDAFDRRNEELVSKGKKPFKFIRDKNIPALKTSEEFKRVKEYIHHLIYEDKQPIFNRIGVRTECLIPKKFREKYRIPNNLEIALDGLADLAKQINIRGGIATKTPEFDDTLATKLRAAKVGVLVSMGYQEHEKGIVAQGFPVQRRLKEALKFADHGVHTTVYIMTDITRPMNQMQRDANIAFEFYHKHTNNRYLHAQFLDARIFNKDSAQYISGDTWKNLKMAQADWLEPITEESGLILPHHPKRYHMTPQQKLAASYVHPDFLKVIKDNTGDIRLCATHLLDGASYCGGCFTDKVRRNPKKKT